MKPHPHSELIKAWADGAEIQIKFYDGWRDCRPIDWNPNSEYRIKPEPKPDVRAWFRTGNINKVMVDLGGSIGVIGSNRDHANLLLTFDGETGELKSAEVLK